MCGIAGIYNSRGLGANKQPIRNMSGVMTHRGPDAEGFHCDRFVHLAARRLAIIDPTAGPQPVYSADNRFCIVYNGEVYNHRQLKSELMHLGHTFKTGTDTEVVLCSFMQWGSDCLDRFNGMFAFGIWDCEKKELFLARDRFGIKPLYYACLADGTLIFASEIKALLQYPHFNRTIYPKAINNMLTYGFNIAPHTFFKDVTQVLPGHFMTISRTGIQTHRYWDIDMQQPCLENSRQDIALMLREKLKQSVKQSLVSDVPVAAYLSGGIDSSAITGLYSTLSEQQIKTLTITFQGAGYDEREYSRTVSDFFNTDNTEFECRLDPDEIEKFVYHLENPLVSLLNMPLYLLSKKTRQTGIKVVLTGDGADEILGGYDYFKLLKAVSFIEKTGASGRKNILKKIFPSLKTDAQAEAQLVYLLNFRDKYPVSHPAMPYQFSEFQFKEHLFSRELLETVNRTPPDTPFYFNIDDIGHRSIIDQALYIETKMRLLNLTLPLSDKMSMANAVEARPLFLDHEFVNFCFTIPSHYKIQGLSEKHILKKSMEGFLPPKICSRKKQPLQPPEKWFVDTAWELIRDRLSEHSIKQAGYFNPAFVDLMLSEHQKNENTDYAAVIVVVFFVQLWHDIFLKRR